MDCIVVLRDPFDLDGIVSIIPDNYFIFKAQRQRGTAVFILDNCDVVAVNEWKAKLEEIKNNPDLETYLMGGGRRALMNWWSKSMRTPL